MSFYLVHFVWGNNHDPMYQAILDTMNNIPAVSNWIQFPSFPKTKAGPGNTGTQSDYSPGNTSTQSDYSPGNTYTSDQLPLFSDSLIDQQPDNYGPLAGVQPGNYGTLAGLLQGNYGPLAGLQPDNNGTLAGLQPGFSGIADNFQSTQEINANPFQKNINTSSSYASGVRASIKKSESSSNRDSDDRIITKVIKMLRRIFPMPGDPFDPYVQLDDDFDSASEEDLEVLREFHEKCYY